VERGDDSIFANRRWAPFRCHKILISPMKISHSTDCNIYVKNWGRQATDGQFFATAAYYHLFCYIYYNQILFMQFYPPCRLGSSSSERRCPAPLSDTLTDTRHAWRNAGLRFLRALLTPGGRTSLRPPSKSHDGGRRRLRGMVRSTGVNLHRREGGSSDCPPDNHERTRAGLPGGTKDHR